MLSPRKTKIVYEPVPEELNSAFIWAISDVKNKPHLKQYPISNPNINLGEIHLSSTISRYMPEFWDYSDFAYCYHVD